MKSSWRNPFFIFGLVLLWRVALLVFTAQPIPANDAFFFDGPVVNWVLHGHYFNPGLSEVFPISGHQVYAAYPPLYQAALTLWMLVFGASVISAMAFHLMLFAISGALALALAQKFFPASPNYALVPLLFFGVTFSDRPEDLAHVFGLTAWLLLASKIAGNTGRKTAAGIAIALLLALYTSVIAGAFYFGAGFLTAATAWFAQRKNNLFSPFIAVAALFAVITFTVARTEPLLWRGFLENARQTSVVTAGFHAPPLNDLIKLIRAAPVFLLALVISPFLFARRKQLAAETWLCLLAGIFAMGAILLFLAMTLISPDYVGYVVYAQILLAAGWLALTAGFFPETKCWPRVLIFGCVVLVSVRALGLTTWGVACAWKNSYWQTHEQLRTELKPFVDSDAPVVVSSAFLYSALEFGVKHPVHSDWYYDCAIIVPGANLQGMIKLHPSKLVLTQFDYYRGFTRLLDQLRQHPGIVTVQVRDEAAVRTPDSIPALQRVVQHISWAPVIVDLDWKN